MNRITAITLAISLGALALAVPASAERFVERGPHRSVVVVVPGHPIHRALPSVVFRRPNVVVRIAPARFMPVVAWRPVVVVRPVADRLVWQDAETLRRADDWTETTFDSNQRGDKLYLQVSRGRVELDFAEVVFGNGDCQVVDFSHGVRGEGLYSLLDFADGRKVDHVRLIARSRTPESRVALMLQK